MQLADVARQALPRPAGCPVHTPRLHALVRVSRGARVLEHHTRRPVLSPCPSHARPARVRSQVCSLWRRGCRLLPLVVRDHREDRAAGVVATPLERAVRASDGPTARARDSARPPPELPRDGGVAQFQPSAGREGVGGRVAGERDPKARDSVGPGPRAFPPSLPRLLAPVGRGPCCCAALPA